MFISNQFVITHNQKADDYGEWNKNEPDHTGNIPKNVLKSVRLVMRTNKV